jgi:hypothetical protein
MAARLLEHARESGAVAEGMELRHSEDPTAAHSGLHEGRAAAAAALLRVPITHCCFRRAALRSRAALPP